MPTSPIPSAASPGLTDQEIAVPPPLEGQLGFRIGRLARQLRRQWALDLKPLGLSPPQAAVLRGVGGTPGCSLRGLARTLSADPMNVKRCVDELELAALVRGGAVGADRRARTLFLTEAGVALARRVGVLAAAQEEWLAHSMSGPELRDFGRALALLEAQCD